MHEEYRANPEKRRRRKQRKNKKENQSTWLKASET